MRRRSSSQDEAAVAIAAIDEAFLADLQEHARMAERTAAAVAGDAGVIHLDGFGRGHFERQDVFFGHGALYQFGADHTGRTIHRKRIKTRVFAPVTGFG